MALNFVRVVSKRMPAVASRQMSSGGPVWFTEDKSVIGSREIVGFGINGSPSYFDRDECPMPAIRFREEDSSIKAIREKEKGDWKKLTLEEKKTLYRFSFCQTFSEFQAPNGDWKLMLGWALFGLGLAYWGSEFFLVMLPTHPLLVMERDYEGRVLSEQRRLDMGIFRERGLARDWDLEKREWKK